MAGRRCRKAGRVAMSGSICICEGLVGNSWAYDASE